MELHPGVFLSKVSVEGAEHWQSDPEVGGEAHVLCDADGVQAGLWRMRKTPEKPIPFTAATRETILVLEGSARIEIAGGPTLELAPGDIASLPKGAETRWHVTAPFKELWVLA